MPVVTNGGKTYTITIRTGAMWDTTPPRQVTAQDEVVGLKRLCNPVAPAGALGYYEATIAGFKSYCNAFLATGSSKTGATVSAMDAFMSSHNIAGVKAVSNLTVQFDLDLAGPGLPRHPVPGLRLARAPGRAGVRTRQRCAGPALRVGRALHHFQVRAH